LKPLSEAAVRKLRAPQARVEALPADAPQAAGEYEVERIVGDRRRGRKIEYLVRWVGYGPESDTWEPATAFRTRGAIDDYWGRARTQTVFAVLGRSSSRRSHGRVTSEVVDYLGHILGPLGVDLFAREWTCSLCQRGVTDFHRQARDVASMRMSLWINPPWYWLLWLGDWLVEFAVGCRIAVVVPHYHGYDRAVANWPGVRWVRRISFPRQVRAWFTDGRGNPRPKPSWPCEVWEGVVVGETASEDGR
jgi:hypothetical protein